MINSFSLHSCCHFLRGKVRKNICLCTLYTKMHAVLSQSVIAFPLSFFMYSWIINRSLTNTIVQPTFYQNKCFSVVSFVCPFLKDTSVLQLLCVQFILIFEQMFKVRTSFLLLFCFLAFGTVTYLSL